MNKKTKKILLLVLKLAIAAALLVLVYRKFDWDVAIQAIVEADKLLLLMALAGFFLSLVIIAIRLWYLMRVQEISIGLWEMVRLTFLGQLFNAVVPGTVGGDLVKAFYAAKHTPHKGVAMITVFIDRLMGLTELALLAAIMLGIIWGATQATLSELWVPATFCGGAIAGVLFIMVFLFSRRFRRMFGLEKAYGKLSIAHHFDAAANAAHKFREHPMHLGMALLLSFAAHSVWIIGVILIAKGLDTPLRTATEWHHYFMFIPLIYIIGAIPVTPGGVGTVEGAYRLFFLPLLMVIPEMDVEKAITYIGTLAIIVRFFDIVRGLPGVIVVVTGTKIPKADAIEAELEGDDIPAE